MGTIQRIVIDTNVILSAFGWGGNPLKVLALLEKGEAQNFTSPALLEELRKAVAYQKLGFPLKLQGRIIEFTLFYSKLVFPEDKFDVVRKDPKDNKFVECAVASKSHYIISGDKHLLGLKKVKGTRILSTLEFLKSISQD